MKMKARSSSLRSLAEQVHHLGLDRDVEGRDRLVGDDQLRLDRERPGDADALALAARELVRVAVDVLGVEADQLEQLLHPGLLLALVQAVHAQRRADRIVADRVPRVERGVRVLEDHLHVAADGAQLVLLAGARCRVPSNSIDAAGGLVSSRVTSRDGRRLAAAGLPDEAEGLALR